MATKSISKNVKFSSKNDGYRLIDALEKSAKSTGSKREISKPCKELRGKEIKNLQDRF